MRWTNKKYDGVLLELELELELECLEGFLLLINN